LCDKTKKEKEKEKKKKSMLRTEGIAALFYIRFVEIFTRIERSRENSKTTIIIIIIFLFNKNIFQSNDNVFNIYCKNYFLI
jgi:hypothetical protein